MAKMKMRILFSALGLILLLGLLAATNPTTPADADSNAVRWFRGNIPTEGKAGNWVLADGSDIQHLTTALDGTLYCYANPSGTDYTLFKSTDSGYSWSYTGKVEDDIVDIATAPDDASVILYATSSSVYQSTDAGDNFISLPSNPGGAGSNNVAITSIDVARQSNYVIAVGTRDTDIGQYGGIYTLDVSMSLQWTDTNLGNYDVYAVAFSPNFPGDRQIVAVVTDETDTLVTSKISDSGWSQTIGEAKLDRDNSAIPTPVAVASSAAIIFPDDYDTELTYEQYIQFVAIDTGSGNGDVYRINSVMAPGQSVATDLNIGSAYDLDNIDVSSIAVTGNAATANLLAGAASSAQVYFSPDGGRNWTRATKEPTGQSKTGVLMSPNFSSSGRAYAITYGTESAFSYTTDSGDTWNQLSLIDTRISDILELAPSPNYGKDDTLFMLTHRSGGKHSLWRSLDSGGRWERVYSSALTDVDTINRVEISPQYGNGSQVVFIAGSSGDPSIWQSTDNGQTFNHRTTRDPTTGASFSVDTWTMVNDNTLFIGSHDGSNGMVYRTTNAGLWYSTATVAGSQPLNSIVLSPNYDQDETILVGNSNGWIYWSNDNGNLFELLPPDATSPPLTGNISVAFDPKYAGNNTIYAASDSQDKGIHRYIIGNRTSWENIDSTLPTDGKISQLMLSDDGTLYATNFKSDGGMERCLDPTYPLGPTFETVTRRLSDEATLTGLWQRGNTLWSIDTTNTRLMAYIDSLAQPVSLTSPSNKTPSIGSIVNYTVRNIGLDWEVLKGATKYKWQLDTDTDFSSVPTGFEGEPRATSVRLPVLEPATTYYWRVRATEPVLSPWSPTSSFTTVLGSESIAPKLNTPEAGADVVGTRPVFQWSAIAWGHHYELLVSTDASFNDPVIAKIGDYALSTTAWQCDVNLNYDTTYYWKVRATGSSTYSNWSAVGAFTTESALAPKPAVAASTPPPPESTLPPQEPSPTPQTSSPPEPSPPEPPPPPMPSQPDKPESTPDLTKWLPYLGGAIFLTMVAILITLLILIILTLKIRRIP